MVGRVLFLDGEPAHRAAFEACCAGAYSVMSACSAREALDCMRRHEVAVLIAAPSIADASNWELFEQVRIEFPDVVRMLVTESTRAETAIEAMRRGYVRRHVVRPWDPCELRMTVGYAAEHYRLRTTLRAMEERLREAAPMYPIGVLAAALARELRAPLVATESNLRRARQLLRGMDPLLFVDGFLKRGRLPVEEVDEALSEALWELRRTLAVVQGIEMPVSPDPTEASDATEALRLALRLMQSELRGTGSLELDVRAVPEVAVPYRKLSQLILNLLVHVLFLSRTQPKAERRLVIRLLPEGTWARLEVACGGPGPTLRSEFDSPGSGEGRPRSPVASAALAMVDAIVDDIGAKIETRPLDTGGRAYRVDLPGLEDTFRQPCSVERPTPGRQSQVDCTVAIEVA